MHRVNLPLPARKRSRASTTATPGNSPPTETEGRRVRRRGRGGRKTTEKRPKGRACDRRPVEEKRREELHSEESGRAAETGSEIAACPHTHPSTLGALFCSGSWTSRRCPSVDETGTAAQKQGVTHRETPPPTAMGGSVSEWMSEGGGGVSHLTVQRPRATPGLAQPGTRKPRGLLTWSQNLQQRFWDQNFC